MIDEESKSNYKKAALAHASRLTSFHMRTHLNSSNNLGSIDSTSFSKAFKSTYVPSNSDVDH